VDPAPSRSRLGIDPGTLDGPSPDDLARLQRAHVRAVSFENLAVVGDPPTEPRALSSVAATADYLTSAPESPFTDDPLVSLATADGSLKRSGETLARFADGTEAMRAVDPSERAALLGDAFGLPVPG